MHYTTKWLSDTARTEELVNFFINHKTDSYISHGEIISGRALDANHWNPDLKDILTAQFHSGFTADQNSKLNILIAENEEGKIIGMLVFNIINGYKNYAVLEDMLLDHSLRGQSLGSTLLDKAVEESKKWNISFVMLESGLNNTGAHHFFNKYGFKKVSENYILTL
ncbi:Acetyltransferase (GNAT) family protein [Chryseobacterium carnipullorum]|uniref:GNAT family N-acetyltransferase n=1 Tax=Chryseobacterium carnipullorum TaxID=1124835 RepID=UPI00090F163F|nr:GNAT family N-acetyltransferase [Chryseobacterium carnipullorum]SHM37070.1 Acetyltransferase (GNAT) family protein [Chryseobacterium carnipullorum]